MVGHISTMPHVFQLLGRQTLGWVVLSKTVRLVTAFLLFLRHRMLTGSGTAYHGTPQPAGRLNSVYEVMTMLFSQYVLFPTLKSDPPGIVRLPCSCRCQSVFSQMSSYRFAKPAFLPLPNRTLVGTNWSDDMAPDRSSISWSGCCSGRCWAVSGTGR